MKDSVIEKRVLVLEDNESNAELIRFYLEEMGYRVKIISEGGLLFRAIADFKPDLVTIDIELPDANGIELFRQMQSNPDLQSVPVVFITVQESASEGGIALGARGFLSKPFSDSDLQQVVQQALQLGSAPQKGDIK